jgi:DNA-binding response OmpR family regulator
VYLPVADAAADSGCSARPVEAPAGRETILLVEDEQPVRKLARRILERRGYRVLEAADADEAVAVFERDPAAIDLLLSDVVLPGRSGPGLAEQLAALKPGLHVMFMSGYTATVVGRHGGFPYGRGFLQKPFTPDGLLAKVREALSGAQPDPRAT